MDKRPEASKVIQILDIKKGMRILDFGCGEGIYTIPVAEAVGDEGRIYALDKKRHKLRQVKKKAKRGKLANIETILSNGEVALDKGSVDIILLFDVLHHIDNKQDLLVKLHNVLKPDGLFSVFLHHHISKEESMEIISQGGSFTLCGEFPDEHIYNFKKGK